MVLYANCKARGALADSYVQTKESERIFKCVHVRVNALVLLAQMRLKIALKQVHNDHREDGLKQQTACCSAVMACICTTSTLSTNARQPALWVNPSCPPLATQTRAKSRWDCSVSRTTAGGSVAARRRRQRCCRVAAGARARASCSIQVQWHEDVPATRGGECGNEEGARGERGRQRNTVTAQPGGGRGGGGGRFVGGTGTGRKAHTRERHDDDKDKARRWGRLCCCEPSRSITGLGGGAASTLDTSTRARHSPVAPVELVLKLDPGGCRRRSGDNDVSAAAHRGWGGVQRDNIRRRTPLALPGVRERTHQCKRYA